MQKKWKCSLLAIVAVASYLGRSDLVFAEEFTPGGTAACPAIAAYETWMQFDTPDTNTPAIDEDGCLNYSLAKMAVRYNLPVRNASILSDSYTFYTAFSEMLSQQAVPKMQCVAAQYADYLTLENVMELSGDAESRITQAYSFCAENGSGRDWSYILKMTTASGSDHYALVDYVDLENQRLYLLDSGSWYIDFLGDEKTMEKGYYITAVYPFHISAVSGDMDGDMRLTAEDIRLLLAQEQIPVLRGDVNHDGAVDTVDVVFLAHALQYQADTPAQYAMASNGVTLPVATKTTQLQPVEPPELLFASTSWNEQIFQKQLERIQ